jgi:peptidoglycan/xylan/chitin deacetylase (PgdA/CDA1 family)
MIKRSIIFLVPLLLLFHLGFSAPQDSTSAKPKSKWHKKICLTFDNLPAERTYNKSERKKINAGILTALKKHNAPAAGFVIGDNIEGDLNLVADWLADGLTIGIMPFSGQDVNDLPSNLFIDDIERGIDALDSILTAHGQYSRYFRFPYLRYGADHEIRGEIEEFLKIENIATAHASIIADDFVYNLSLEKIVKSEDSLRIGAIVDEYIAHVIEVIRKAEKLASELAGRQIKQIIQFHSNKINGMFLDDLLSTLERNGYQFISLRDALEDKIYTFPDTYFGNQSISFLERIKLTNFDYIPAVDSGQLGQ